MPSLRALRTRINSVKSTNKLTNAMKTIALSKYNAASAKWAGYEAYSEKSAEILAKIPSGSGKYAEKSEKTGKKCFVLITSNRGLCGSYNNDILKFFKTRVSGEDDPHIIVCGRWGAGKLKDAEYFPLPDLPGGEDARRLLSRIKELFSGGCDEIYFVYQDYVNMLVNEAVAERLLPFEQLSGAPDEWIIYSPDKEEASSAAEELLLNAKVYSILLRAARGAQAATLIAMRASSDNSEAMLEKLELTYNRVRQTMVTTQVIEISSSTFIED